MKHLRTALEDNTPESDKTILMKGPLSEVYTRALDVEYAKADPVTAEVALESLGFKVSLESQQLDVAAVTKLISLITPAQPVTTGETTVYGVAKSDVTDETVIEVTQELADSKKDDAPDFVLIIDGTQSDGDAPEKRFIELPTALESIVVACGGRVYHSLPEFAKTL